MRASGAGGGVLSVSMRWQKSPLSREVSRRASHAMGGAQVTAAAWATGVRKAACGLNGSFPGPTARVRIDRRISLVGRVVNHLTGGVYA